MRGDVLVPKEAGSLLEGAAQELTAPSPGDVTQLYYRIPSNDWEKSE